MNIEEIYLSFIDLYLLASEIPLQHALTGAGSLLRKSFIERLLLFVFKGSVTT